MPRLENSSRASTRAPGWSAPSSAKREGRLPESALVPGHQIRRNQLIVCRPGSQPEEPGHVAGFVLDAFPEDLAAVERRRAGRPERGPGLIAGGDLTDRGTGAGGHLQLRIRQLRAQEQCALGQRLRDGKSPPRSRPCGRPGRAIRADRISWSYSPTIRTFSACSIRRIESGADRTLDRILDRHQSPVGLAVARPLRWLPESFRYGTGSNSSGPWNQTSRASSLKVPAGPR